MTPKRILIVVANPTRSTTLGWPVGFWAAELVHPYHTLTEAGHRVTIASPDGGRVEWDAYSDPRDASGYAKDDELSRAYLARPDFLALLERTPAVGTLDPRDFDAVIVAGGQSPMFTFRHHAALAGLFLAFARAGKPSAALCHGTCLLLDLRNADGSPFVRGRRMTGFSNPEEDFADQAVGQKVMPFRIEDEARTLGADFVTAPPFQPFAVRDGNLITGQQQHSGHAVAQAVLETLRESSILNPVNIAFIGVGQVGGALAHQLLKAGHRVTVAARDPHSDSVRKAQAASPGLVAQAPAAAVAGADVVFLATPYHANAAALAGLALDGKVLVDCTNPVATGLTHGLQSRTSGAEEVQRLAPGARVVKAFTIYGFENFEDSRYPGYGDLRPAMLIAGDDADAKSTVSRLCEQLGWRPVDSGPLSNSLHLEHLTLLWIKMGRVQGKGANFVWAMLER